MCSWYLREIRALNPSALPSGEYFQHLMAEVRDRFLKSFVLALPQLSVAGCLETGSFLTVRTLSE